MNQNVIGRCAWLLALIGLIGCSDDQYRRAADLAERAADRQAEQNTEMARLNREVAEGTRRMVEADATARQEIIDVHHDLQAERTVLNEGFNALETERKGAARQRRMESILVPVARAGGFALVAAAVVGLCCILLLGLRKSEATDVELNDLLLEDLGREQPRLFVSRDAAPVIEGPKIDDQDETLLLEPAHHGNGESTEQGDTT